jgi:putative addiction module component
MFLRMTIATKPPLDLSTLTADRDPERDDFPLTPELRDELDRRLDRMDREGPSGIDWEDVLAEMIPRA